MSLYVKYRPTNFDELIDQNYIKEILKLQITNWETLNSYIFYWSKWTWKTSTARILSKWINCLDLKNWNPCNKCKNCLDIDNNQTIDFVEIDAASHTWVDDVRDIIIEKSWYPPISLKKKIYIIDEAHMLSNSAFNALLKIVEEPPAYLVFILATTELNKIPETIASRCQVYNFKRFSIDSISNQIKLICDKEKISYDENWLRLISKFSEWAMRDAIKYIEQLNLFWQINEENVMKFLWITWAWNIKKLINLFELKDIENSIIFLDNLYENWIDFENFCKDVIIYLNENYIENKYLYFKLSKLFIDIYGRLKNNNLQFIIFKSMYINYIQESDWQNDISVKLKENIVSTQNINYQVKQKENINDNNTTIPQKQEIKVENLNNLDKNDKEIVIDIEKLFEKFIEIIDKISIKSILKKTCKLTKESNNYVLFVLNELNYWLISKEENFKYLELKFKQSINDQNINFLIKFIDKNDYLSLNLI